ncbi:MAG: PAS domain-containing protein [Oligoflexia bacterium]|nr:PAS domain-containing protein [Oligoflexia bacterium]
MITKLIDIPRKCFIRILLHLSCLIVLLFIYLFYNSYLTTNHITETLSKNKLANFSDSFISSYKSIYEKTKNEKNAFDITTERFIDHKEIHLIRIRDDKQNILHLFTDAYGTKISSTISSTTDKSNNTGFTDDYFKTTTYLEKKYAISGQPFTLHNGSDHLRYLEILITVDDVKKSILEILIEVIIIILLIMLLVIPLFFLTLKKMLRPIHRLSLDIQKLKSNPPILWRQLKHDSRNGFLKEIIISVNELIFRTQRSLICQENLGRFLAHEIKTPLTHLMNEIEVVNRESTTNLKSNKEFYKQSMQSVSRIRSIVNNICDLAYSDSSLYLETKNNIVSLLSDTICEFERVYTTKINFENNINSSVSPGHGDSNEAFIMVNSDYFWILCSNILRNSLDHGNGYKVIQTVQLSKTEDKYKIEFKDYGPGFPFSKNILEKIDAEENVDQLLKSKGTGLVLCLKLSEIMGIEIKLKNHIPQGASVTLLFENINKPALATVSTNVNAETIINVHIDMLKKKLMENEKYINIVNKEIISSNNNTQFLNNKLNLTKEELESSNDELLNVNQELSVINNELKDKVAELSHVKNDMNNLLTGNNIGTILIDHQLQIKRFSPFIGQAFNLPETTIGKQIDSTTLNLINYNQIITDISNVLSTLLPKQIEVQTNTDKWYLLTIRPYRTLDNIIDGALITLIEITDSKKR